MYKLARGCDIISGSHRLGHAYGGVLTALGIYSNIHKNLDALDLLHSHGVRTLLKTEAARISPYGILM